MEPIKITENQDEMIEIAKGIVEKKKAYYNDQLISFISDFVWSRMPDATAKEIEDTVYITIYHYWVYGSTYEECLNYDFRNKNHREKLTYMTLRLRLIYINYLSRKEDAHLLSNKYETYQIFKNEYKREVIRCETDEDFPRFKEFTKEHREFVVKPTDLSGGKGVYKTSICGLKNDDELRDFYHQLLGESRNSQEKYMHGNAISIVIEEIIDQAPEMAAFNPASINGIRLPTVKVDGKVHVYQPWFKIGRGGNFLTSSIFGTLLAGINVETGIVDTPGTTETGEEWENHPDTKLQILGFQIPKWEELKEFAKECAMKLPTIGYVGWDFALTNNGWCIMEGNHSGDFMWQVYRHKGMKQDFENLIGWKFGKEFWWQ